MSPWVKKRYTSNEQMRKGWLLRFKLWIGVPSGIYSWDGGLKDGFESIFCIKRMINAGAQHNLFFFLFLGAAISPVGRPTSIEGANEIAPAPAPETSGSASHTAQAYESLVFALVVASSSFIWKASGSTFRWEDRNQRNLCCLFLNFLQQSSTFLGVLFCFYLLGVE